MPVPKAPRQRPSTPVRSSKRASASSRSHRQHGSSRYDKIVQMIEQSEKLKSAAENKAAHLADKLVPYTLAGSGADLPADPERDHVALSVLMVDFSCALKLAMPLAVLSAMREASG